MMSVFTSGIRNVMPPNVSESQWAPSRSWNSSPIHISFMKICKMKDLRNILRNRTSLIPMTDSILPDILSACTIRSASSYEQQISISLVASFKPCHKKPHRKIGTRLFWLELSSRCKPNQPEAVPYSRSYFSHRLQLGHEPLICLSFEIWICQDIQVSGRASLTL